MRHFVYYNQKLETNFGEIYKKKTIEKNIWTKNNNR